MTEIEYFYSAHSAFAYLGSARFMAIAAAAGRRIAHRPMDLHRVMEAAGAPGFTARSRAHRAYFFGREIVRWAEYRGVPVMAGRPTHHDRDTQLPNCLLIAALEAGAEVDRLTHGLLEAHWRDDADLSDPATLARLARAHGHEPDALLRAAMTPAVRDRYEANTREAIRRSIFGSPTYGVDGDLFYGQDHLELVERALERPFA